MHEAGMNSADNSAVEADGTEDADGGEASEPSPRPPRPRHVYTNTPPIAEGVSAASSSAGELQDNGDSASVGWSNDCEAVPRVASAVVTVVEAGKAVTDPAAAAGTLDLPAAEKAQRYMEELLQLREVVETLGAHLDAMIAHTESNACCSSHVSSKSGFRRI